MGRIVIVISLAAVMSLAPAALGSQPDDRLDALFDRLQTTDSEVEAAALTSQVWAIWQQSDSVLIDAFMTDGIGEMSRRNYREALVAFNKVVEADPEFAEGWNKRATVYYLMGEYVASVRDIERTLTLEPRHFGALSGFGLLNLALGEESAALKAFEAALKVNPHLPGARAHAEALRRRLHGKPI